MKKRIVILGAGESGVGAALLAKAKGFDTFVSDMHMIGAPYKKILEENNIPFEEGSHSDILILSADEVVKSPGIPDKAPVVVKIRQKGIPVIAEIEFAGRFTKAKFVAITGTNGKTTTTMLAYHLLKKGGLKVGLAGNIGISLAKQVIDDDFDIYVLEISSFQLDGMFDFKADVAILLNITPDHLDRYDYKFGHYIDSKFRITQNMTQNGYFIFFQDSEVLMREVDSRQIGATPLPVSLRDKVGRGAWLEDDRLHFQAGSNDPIHVHIEDIIIKGRHNLINSMTAVLCALVFDVDMEKIRKGLADFKNAPHRLEVVAEIDGVKYINDSKATNLDAVIYALDSFKEDIIWIAGGIDKGNNYELVKDLARNRVKALICLGKDNTKLVDFFADKVPVVEESTDVYEAAALARKFATSGDVVLLSPACASFDLFKNYEDRGDQFRAAVLDLKNANSKIYGNN